MKKILYLLLAQVVATQAMAQTYPSSFAWDPGLQKDQQVQGPCHIFASVAAVESWYKILYGGSVPDLSEAQLFSPCDGGDPESGRSILESLTFMKNNGVVSNACIEYEEDGPCYIAPNSNHYFSYLIQKPPLTDCGTPLCNCSGAAATERYRVADFVPLAIDQFTSANDLKRAILNHGPIPLWFFDNTIHNLNHAYMLYGWTSSGKAMLKDSWPGATTPNVSKSLDGIITLFKNNPGFKAFTLKSTAQKPGVYKQVRNNNVWQDASLTTPCTNAIIPTLFTISRSPNVSYVCNPGVTYSISGPFNLYDPQTTVVWSYESVSGGAAVSFTPATGTSTSVKHAGGDGYVNIVASVKRPSGICESYKRLNVRVSQGIPVTVTKTYDQCAGSYRSIQYTASSIIGGLSYNWTFFPSPGSNHYTYVSNYSLSSVYTMNFYNLPIGYGLTVNVTDPNYPGAVFGSTQGGYAMSCGGFGFAMAEEPSRDAVKELSVYPIPATDRLNVSLSDGNYEVALIDKFGQTVFTRISSKSVELDVGALEQGVYLLRITPVGKTGKSVVRRVVVE